MKKKIIVYIVLLILFIPVAILLYWLYSAPKEVLVVTPNPIQVTTKSAKAGEYVLLHYDVCKNINATGRIVVTLVGETVQLSLPTGRENTEKGCQKDLTVPLPVPPLTATGSYYYRFRVTYPVNPLKTIVQEYRTENFGVIGKE